MLGVNTPQGGETEFGLVPFRAAKTTGRRPSAQALDYVAAVGGRASIASPARSAGAAARGGEALRRKPQARRRQAAAHKIKLYIEPINPRDLPNYFLTQVEHAADIIGKVGSDNVFIQYDFYHVQIVGGDIIERFKKYQPLIAHLQCSQVPVRHEPDADGEINYPFVFGEIDRLGFQGWIGAEYNPRGRTEDGLGLGTALRRRAVKER